jgi:hypothetical protein
MVHRKAKVRKSASAAKTITPVILVYGIGIDGEGVGIIAESRRLPQPLCRRLRSRGRTINFDQLGVLGARAVITNVMKT